MPNPFDVAACLTGQALAPNARRANTREEVRTMTTKAQALGVETDADSIRELDLYAENTERLYGQFTSIIRNLQRKIAAGRYSPTLAPKLWRYWYDEAARQYKREHGYAFPVAVRQAAAEERATDEYQRIISGEYDA